VLLFIIMFQYNEFILFFSVDCLSVKKLTGVKEDGEYEMRVFGHDNRIAQIFIYCHHMSTETPTE